MLWIPPLSCTALDFCNNEGGTDEPPISSMAAGKFSDARTLAQKNNNLGGGIYWVFVKKKKLFTCFVTFFCFVLFYITILFLF